MQHILINEDDSNKKGQLASLQQAISQNSIQNPKAPYFISFFETYQENPDILNPSIKEAFQTGFLTETWTFLFLFIKL